MSGFTISHNSEGINSWYALEVEIRYNIIARNGTGIGFSHLAGDRMPTQ